MFLPAGKSILTALCSLVTLAWSQTFYNGFNFYLPADDTTHQLFLPHFPIQPIAADDFISIDSYGHFTSAGHRIRFWGVNLTADGAFPSLSKAGQVAGRLRKMGFNLIRFHHLDNNWSREAIFEWGSDTRHLNPITLQRLDHFIYQLKNNGLRVNMNLHVSRTFNRKDGISDADSIKDFAKGVGFFDPQMLPLYKEYAQQLLTHINPYTQLPLTADPVMAMVEITNENSLYRMWQNGDLRHFSQGGKLTVRHVKMLDQLWIDFLRRKYGSDYALRQIWAVGSRQNSHIDLVSDGGFENKPLSEHWQMELHESGRGVMAPDMNYPYSGLLCARITVTQADGVGWHVQWKRVGGTIVKDSLYTCSFAVRSDENRIITAGVMRDDSPWTTYGSTTVRATPEWQKVSYSFRAPENCNQVLRITFNLAQATGTVWFDEIHLTPIVINGLTGEESLDSGVRRVEYADGLSYTDKRIMDLSDFYIQVQDDFFTEMEHYIKNELHVAVPVVRTNWNTGPADLYLQSKGDYIDNHVYWDHPYFPNQPWSSTDWSIQNNPMVLNDEGGAISASMAGVGLRHKPFTISEYNHPFPNQYQSEGALFLCSYGAFHDLDAVMLFDYGGSQYDWETDKIDGYFAIHRNSAMMSLMPSCSRVFRDGLINKAMNNFFLRFTVDQVLSMAKSKVWDWQGPLLFDKRLALQHLVRNYGFVTTPPMLALDLPLVDGPPYITDTREILWDPQGILQTVTDRFIGFTGLLHRYAGRSLGPLKILSCSDFATVTWLSLTDRALTHSERSLFTVSSKIQNLGMIWDGTTTLHNQWGTPPTLMSPVTVRLELQAAADTILVYPLSAIGAVQGVARVYPASGPGVFQITLDTGVEQTLWFGLECLGHGTEVKMASKSPLVFHLAPAFPNPFTGTGEIAISFTLPVATRSELKVFDLLGREVYQRSLGVQSAGSHVIPWDGRDCDRIRLANGVYFYRLSTELGAKDNVRVGKLMLLR